MPTLSADASHVMEVLPLRDVANSRAWRQPALGPFRTFTKSQTASWFFAFRQAFFQLTFAGTRRAPVPDTRSTAPVSTRRSFARAVEANDALNPAMSSAAAAARPACALRPSRIGSVLVVGDGAWS